MTDFKEILSTAEIREFKEAFSLFNKSGDGVLTHVELGDLLRAVGSTPTDEELRTMVNAYDTTGKNQLNFPAFLQMMASLRPESLDNENNELFSMLSSGEEVVSASSLRHVFTSLGEKLTDEEVILYYI